MSTPLTDKAFSASIPKLYEAHMVPLIFQPYADDLVQRLAARPLTQVLEIAAGTGVVTRAMASALPADVAIVATDLNPPMLAMAAEIGTSRPVTWRQADAMQLPFADGSFDAVVCQFGAMFFPDKAAAFAQVWRVLKPGGVFLFNVWDRIEENAFADTVTAALAAMFPDDPPRFLARTPHGYHDPQAITRDLAAGGFTAVPQLSLLSARSRADAARDVATAFCEGTPLRNEIEARDATRLLEARDRVTQALALQFGTAAVEGKMQALVVRVDR